MPKHNDLSLALEEQDRIERSAVRIVLVDSSGAILLLSTRDASNPSFKKSWELPGGGIEPDESITEAVIREVREETGLNIYSDDVSEPLWHRSVLYTYRGEKRLQHEAICVAKIFEASPEIDVSEREENEIEDHLFHRWWEMKELSESEALFYPRNLPMYIEALLSGQVIDDPFESWE